MNLTADCLYQQLNAHLRIPHRQSDSLSHISKRAFPPDNPFFIPYIPSSFCPHVLLMSTHDHNNEKEELFRQVLTTVSTFHALNDENNLRTFRNDNPYSCHASQPVPVMIETDTLNNADVSFMFTDDDDQDDDGDDTDHDSDEMESTDGLLNSEQVSSSETISVDKNQGLPPGSASSFVVSTPLDMVDDSSDAGPSTVGTETSIATEKDIIDLRKPRTPVKCVRLVECSTCNRKFDTVGHRDKHFRYVSQIFLSPVRFPLCYPNP